MPGTIRNIIFDLGNVLVRVDCEKFENGLLSEGITRTTRDRIFASDHLKLRFESGEISEKEFLDIATREFNHEITPERFIHHFNSMFSEIPQMKEFLTGLYHQRHHRLVLLSNTNPLHFSHFKENFDYINLFDYIALSFELKLLKPDIRIFNRVLQLYDLNAEDTLFIDDLKENCASAAQAGMYVIQYGSENGLHDDFIHRFNEIAKTEFS